MADADPGVRERIDAIEEAYEFFLAYAAQGLKTDAGAKAGGEVRTHLKRAIAASDGLAEAVRRQTAVSAVPGIIDDAPPAKHSSPGVDPWKELLVVLERDARATLSALRLVDAQRSVSSQLIDNLNANVHFRALLTGLFLVDEVLDPVT